ncbi:hypothetical protein E8E11_002480 [Didymella keratinophila]|nr:hypothetical protein E8E11_002480 [Didymella keratinophila]
MLLAAANANRDNIPVKKRSGIICRCTYRALEQSNSPLAIKLLSWHMQHLVRHSCVPFAEAAFAVATYSLDTKQGLREAISQDNLPMVELFLKNGADPEGVESWRRDPEFHRGTCELARPGFKVYKIVREAVAKKVRRLKGTYEPLRFWVWDVKRQMDVPVAYTFHAPEL